MNIKVLGGSSHPSLLAIVCDRLAIKPGTVTLKKFSNRESRLVCFVRKTSVNGC